MAGLLEYLSRQYIRLTYLLWVGIALACERGETTYQSDPDAVRDLLVDRISWRPIADANRPGVQLNEHQFSITNTSGEHSYRQIQVRFDYYDSLYHRIDTRRYIVPRLIEPRSAVAIPPVQAGKIHLLAKSATVRIEQALVD